MRSLSLQRCFNHAHREAAARCPECTHFYCRECITEHDDRVICAACLRKLAKVPFTQRTGFVSIVRSVQLAAGLVVREVPIDFVERVRGDSKMSGAIATESLKRITAWGLRERRDQVRRAWRRR